MNETRHRRPARETGPLRNGQATRQPRADRGPLLRIVEDELRAAVIDDLAAETQQRSSTASAPLSTFNRRQLAHATIVRLLSDRFNAAAARGEEPLSPDEERLVRDNVIAAVFQTLPSLDALLNRGDVTDILLNGPSDARVRTVDGREEEIDPIFGSEREMIAALRALARRGGDMVAGDDLLTAADDGAGQIEQEFSETRPYLDLRLSPSGARLAAVGTWVTTTGTHISIRRHPLLDADQRYLVEDCAMYSPELASLLGAAMRAGWRILLSGRPGIGKTTLLRALAHELHPSTRVVVIEQNPELGLDEDRGRHNHVVGLVERPANMEGVGAVTIGDHVRAAQRHLPDCLIVGEVRGAEVIALLKALSMDVPGLCTLHAQSSTNVFSRLVFYAKEADSSLDPEYVLRAAAEGLDLIVHLGSAPDGRRVVAEVLHVSDFDEVARRPITDEWYVPGPDGYAVHNPKSPIPADVVRELSQYGYDAYLPGGTDW
jgi:Flp pilus assembly CpaF family ATPase